MNRSNTIIIIFAVLFLVFGAFLFAPPFWKLESVTVSALTTGSSGRREEALIRMNRLTGATYKYLRGFWEPIRIRNSKRAGAPLGFDATSKITGRAGFEDNDFFTVSIYNGSPYRLTAIRIQVTMECTAKTDGFVREYYEEADIDPLSEDRISFRISKPASYIGHTWSITKVYGTQELD